MKKTPSDRSAPHLLTGAASLIGSAVAGVADPIAAPKRLGICTYSYGAHWRAAREGDSHARFKDVASFFDHCHALGAGGVQVAVGTTDLEAAAKLRAKAEALGIYFEGQASLPRNESDVDRFDLDIRACKAAGATVVRVACLSGRRYETFDSVESFREFSARSWQSVAFAEPIVRKHGVRMAIENHKDWRTDEFLELLNHIGSDLVGVCIDTGNNLALLEDPYSVVEALAPFAFTTHLKDMALADHETGFLLSEVPMGEGFLDLKRITQAVLKSNPAIQFNLEMITRDPLKIPCLTDRYWATMPKTPARRLAAAVARVRENPPRTPLPRITGLKLAEQLEFEDRNVRESFRYAREHLQL